MELNCQGKDWVYDPHHGAIKEGVKDGWRRCWWRRWLRRWWWMWLRALTSMTNRAKLSLSSEENPNPTRMNLLRDGGVPEQDDAVVIGDLVVTMVDSAEQQWQQMVRPEVAVDRMKVEKLYQNRINGVNRK
ncbi:hypothetical protein GmHk_02G003880 [Glycine max]|nr:hypothetical protein GmHk_02G003880 [Glycine max]